MQGCDARFCSPTCYHCNKGWHSVYGCNVTNPFKHHGWEWQARCNQLLPKHAVLDHTPKVTSLLCNEKIAEATAEKK